MLVRKACGLLLAILFAREAVTQVCHESVIVDAIGSNGFPVMNLNTADFKASHKGHSLPVISSAQRSDPGVRIVILLDTSASMALDGGRYSVKWKIARDAALDLISAAPPQAALSLLTFTTSIRRRFDSAGGRGPMESWLHSDAVLKASEVRGLTALYATASEAIDQMKPAHPGDSIFVITDGGDTEGKESIANVARELQSNGIRLFSFLLNDSLGTSRTAQQLYDLAKQSGGLTFIVNPYTAGTGWAGSGFGRRYEYDEKKVVAVRADAKWAVAAMANFYILTMGVESLTKPEELQLDIVDKSGDKRKDLTIMYPARIGGCVTKSTAP